MKKSKKINEVSISHKHKQYEFDYEKTIEPEKHIIIRIDGHHFSSFTKDFEKPFDKIISNSMIETTKDLLERFDAYTGYTQSDEITLFLPSLKDLTVDNRKKKTHKLQKRIKEDWEHIFNARVQKIVSLVAAYTTMSFNKHLDKNMKIYTFDVSEERKNDLFKLINTGIIGTAYFDARIYGVSNEKEVFEAFLWRVQDAEKNSKSMFTQTYCNYKELEGKSGEEKVEYCKNKKNKDWNDIEDKFKYGTFVKKEMYFNEEIKKKSKIVNFSKILIDYSDEDILMVNKQFLN
jgi:tRNA(His) 5'-end guanylyltransferase